MKNDLMSSKLQRTKNTEEGNRTELLRGGSFEEWRQENNENGLWCKRATGHSPLWKKHSFPVGSWSGEQLILKFYLFWEM